MRSLSVIAAFCFSGAVCVTVLAEQRDPTASEPPDQGPARLAPRAPDPEALPSPARPVAAPAPSRALPSPASGGAGPDATVFGNTYYDFPVEQSGPADTPLYTTRCELITVVPASFHDRLCVQGSGQLASGETVSFAARDCACASLCPRTRQRICFEVLDPARFPCGRGATGRPITPLRTVAVDPAVIPMGKVLFIPEFVGVPRADGAPHDGCFVAEDQGLAIRGHRIDVFAGDEGTRRLWDAAVPSHRGVHVFAGEARCPRAPARELSPSGGRTRSGCRR